MRCGWVDRARNSWRGWRKFVMDKLVQARVLEVADLASNTAAVEPLGDTDAIRTSDTISVVTKIQKSHRLSNLYECRKLLL